jgi:hypothetical protein
MSMIYRSDQVAKFTFHDSRLTSILWSGEDVIFSLTWLPPLGLDIDCPKGPTPSRLVTRYTTDLAFDIEFGDLIGAPSIYDLTMEPLPHDRWKVFISFLALPDGFIRFECNDIMLLADPH